MFVVKGQMWVPMNKDTGKFNINCDTFPEVENSENNEGVTDTRTADTRTPSLRYEPNSENNLVLHHTQ